jgi:hypothetical protein
MTDRTREPGAIDALDVVGGNRAAVAEALGRIRTQRADSVHVRARVLGGGRGERRVFERVGSLTPYVVETIVEDVLHAGRGARLEVTVRWDAEADEVDDVQRSFATLVRKGVAVSVRRAPAAGEVEASPGTD